jgi:hypothetical protein
MATDRMKDPPPVGPGARACLDSATGGLAGEGAETREGEGRHPSPDPDTWNEGARIADDYPCQQCGARGWLSGLCDRCSTAERSSR